MKRLATKKMLTPEKLTADERWLIYRTTKLPSELQSLKWIFCESGQYGRIADWHRITYQVYLKYRAQLTREESCSLCYEALRNCVVLNKHKKLGYVYRACVNSHKRLLRERKNSCLPIPEGFDVGVETDWESLDFEIDLDSAMKAAAFNGTEFAICRERLVEGSTFEEIAKSLGTSRMAVHRIFRRCLRRLGTLTRDYGMPAPEQDRDEADAA